MKVFICDVDGVMTDGKFYYTKDGKILKSFGPDDNDALKVLSQYLMIHFISGDERGFEISRKRIVEDMKFPLDLVSTIKRMDWIKERFSPADVIYMGDGVFDHLVFAEVGYSIAPQNADQQLKKIARYVTNRSGGDRAVSEACLHVIQKYFNAHCKFLMPGNTQRYSGDWGI
jgi:3-deoxy-D-manno-octulosonate 8-phosphate phosphatase (KDO 8-P phosphatase)